MESRFVYLEKHHERQARFYAMYLAQTLFGDWTLIRCWGRIGHQGGKKGFAKNSDALEGLL